MSENSSPLTRDERMWCGARDGCTFEMIEGMAVFGATGGNPSGSRPNFFGRQHLTFDKGGKFSAGDSAENLIDGADGEQSPPSRLGIVSES